MIPRPALCALRFGTGLPVPDGAPQDAAGLLAALSGPDAAAARYPVAGLDRAWPAVVAVQTARMERRKRTQDGTSGGTEAADATQAEARTLAEAGIRATVARAVDAADGFRERLVRFWADHFTVRARRGFDMPLVLAFAEEAIRPHLTGPFAAMLRAATLHPAMLLSLDQAESVGPNSRAGKRRGRGLNENLARELIELHTLGVGAAYTQNDVRQLAELLTGLTVDPEEGFVFRPQWAEPGSETILGKTYDGKAMAPILEILGELAARPETAAHLARKLVVHFVADDPPEPLVAAVTAAWTASGGALQQVYTALLGHETAWEDTLSKARQPWDFTVAALKALGVDGARVMDLPDRAFRRRLLQPMAGMGQPFGAPRGPDGWAEEAAAWITPQGLGARVAWAMTQPEALVSGPLPDPIALAERALGPAADARLLWAAARAETAAQGVGLVLASPAFNRR